MRKRILSLAWRPVCSMFHFLSYSLEGWKRTHWLGVPILKLPSDLWMYHEVVWETRPDLIVETGTARGGSALFFASLFDLMRSTGRVVTVDLVRCPEEYPAHPRIQFITGSSTSPETLAMVRAQIRPGDRVMVVLDSDHSEVHVRKELELYSPLVTPGCYLVVEDTNVNGHPVFRTHGPGPMEAVVDFLASDSGRLFESDRSRDHQFGFTFYPRGWLRRDGPVLAESPQPVQGVTTSSAV
jgi:cephalosporin hydroxylase